MSGKPRKKTAVTFYRDLGQALRVARGKAGRTQEEIAEYLDVTFQQIQKYETGKNRIPVDSLVNLADFLEVPVATFIEPSADDTHFQALASQLSAPEFHALIEAWGSLKDRPVRAALLNLVRCMTNLKR